MKPRPTAAIINLFELFGFEVVTARDGQEALDQLQALLADGVNVRAMILDMTMPRLDGNGVIKELKRREINLPVILSSGYNTSEIAGRFEDGMVASFIQKPYQMTSLRNTLRDVLAH